MNIRIINANSGATRTGTFECFHGGKKSPWAEIRLGMAGVYNFSLRTGWCEHKSTEAPAWFVLAEDLELLREAAREKKLSFTVAPIQAPQRSDAKPRKARGPQVAPPAV